MRPRRKSDPDETITIPIPLPGGKRWTRVTLPREMTEAEWAYWINVLEVMKTGIVPAGQLGFVDQHIDPDLMGPGES